MLRYTENKTTQKKVVRSNRWSQIYMQCLPLSLWCKYSK